MCVGSISHFVPTPLSRAASGHRQAGASKLCYRVHFMPEEPVSSYVYLRTESVLFRQNKIVFLTVKSVYLFLRLFYF